MKWIVTFFHFWYDFIVGDSWQIALGVALTTAVFYVLAHQFPASAGVLAPVYFLVLLVVFASALLIEQKNKK